MAPPRRRTILAASLCLPLPLAQGGLEGRGEGKPHEGGARRFLYLQPLGDHLPEQDVTLVKTALEPFPDPATMRPAPPFPRVPAGR